MTDLVLNDLDIGNIRKLDYLMSRDRDFPIREQGATRRYLLCSTARCGSTLVGDILHRSGLAGDPQEYLNGRLIAAYLRAANRLDGKVNIFDYLDDIETRRTSENGVFGIKVHFEHVLSLWQKKNRDALKFLQRFDKIILLTRQDKLAQAVSLHKARSTQIWTSEDYQFLEDDDPRKTRKASYDPFRISRALGDILLQENGWKSTLSSAKLKFGVIQYEDFVANPDNRTRQLFNYLDLPEPTEQLVPSVQRQSRGADPLLEAFRKEIGLTDQ